MRVSAIKKDRLFDQTLAYNLSKKIYVFLGSARTYGDVVHARDRVIHRLALQRKSHSPEYPRSQHIMRELIGWRVQAVAARKTRERFRVIF
jgi:hypothetical protein